MLTDVTSILAFGMPSTLELVFFALIAGVFAATPVALFFALRKKKPK